MFLYSFTGFLSISASYPLIDKYLVKPIEEMQRAQEAEAAGEAEQPEEAAEATMPEGIPEFQKPHGTDF
jgi:hypothetical protein